MHSVAISGCFGYVQQGGLTRTGQRALRDGMSRTLPRSHLTATATLLGGALFAGPALADCSQSGGTVTCTGALSDVFYTNAAPSLVVQDLIANPFGGVQIQWFGTDGTGNGNDGTAAEDQSISFAGAVFGLTLSAPGSVGVAVGSRGGDGSSGDHDTVVFGTARSDPGGNGGEAGNATLNFASGFVTFQGRASGTLAGASSVGGAGGPSDEARVDGGGAAHGGNGGSGGDAGEASAT
jgi:hypothetical protein